MTIVFLLTLGFQDWSWLQPSHLNSIPFFDQLEDMRAPLELDADKDGNLYVADLKASCIWKIAPDGTALFSFGRKGQGPGEFNTVYDIAVDRANGRVWVSDQLAWRVACYDLEGKLLLHKTLSNIQPYSIACLDDGNVVIGGTGNNNLLLFDQNLNLLKAFGHEGNKPMEGANLETQTRRFMSLLGHKNRVYVAYDNRPEVEVYNSEGKLLWKQERPWVHREEDPLETSGTNGGMSFKAEEYHRNQFVWKDVLYVTSAPKENAVFAFSTESGRYLGHYIPKQPMYMRGICQTGGVVYSLAPLDGLFRVHQLETPPKLKKLHRADDFQNRYVLSEKLHVSESSEKPSSCGGEEKSCTCSHGSQGCASGCCSG